MLRRALERVLELPAVYDLNQAIGRPTVRLYNRFLVEEVKLSADTYLLEIGCGTGASRHLVPGRYCGIDINPNYIATARRSLAANEFIAMDATKLAFPDRTFDQSMSIATTHHLDDSQLEAVTSEALRVVRAGGAFHIIDAVLPLDPRERFKEMYFKMDRGRHARHLDQLVRIVSRCATVQQKRVLNGTLHDVAYLKVVPTQ